MLIYLPQKGIEEKGRLSIAFLKLRIEEYEMLKSEILTL
jgi:hypothetical protein